MLSSASKFVFQVLKGQLKDCIFFADSAVHINVIFKNYYIGHVHPKMKQWVEKKLNFAFLSISMKQLQARP